MSTLVHNSTTSFTDRSTRPQYVFIPSSVRSDRNCAHVLVRPIKTRNVSASPHSSLTLQTSKRIPKHASKHASKEEQKQTKNNAAPPPTQTEEQTVVAQPLTENDGPLQNPPSDDSKSEGQMSIFHVIYVTIIWSYERTARIHTLLIWSYCKRNFRWKDWIQTQ